MKSHKNNFTFSITLILTLAILNHCVGGGNPQPKAEEQPVSSYEAEDTIAPTPGNYGLIEASNVSATSMTLQWSAAADNRTSHENLQYVLYYSLNNNICDLNSIELNGTFINQFEIAKLSENLSSLTSNTNYYFNVIVKDKAGNRSAYACYEATTSNVPDSVSPSPGNSGQLNFSNISTNSLTISWQSASDNVTATENLKYAVYLSTTNNLNDLSSILANGSMVAGFSSAIESKNISELSSNTDYYFNVIVEDAAGNRSAYTSAVQKTAIAADNSAPIPGNSGLLNINASGANSVTVNWVKANDNFSAQSELQYKVYYSTKNNINTVLQTSFNGIAAAAYQTDIQNINISGLAAGKEFHFNVIVKDVAGNTAIYTSSAFALTKSISAPTNVQVAPGQNQNGISWSDTNFPESAHNYANNTDDTQVFSLPSATSLSVTFNSLTNVEDGSDFIHIRDKNNNPIVGSPFTGTSLAGATITIPGNTVKINLTSDYWTRKWGYKVDQIKDQSGESLLKYNLYYSTTSPVTASSNKFSNVSSSYSHTGLPDSTTYYYAIASVVNGVESVLSSVVTGTTNAQQPDFTAPIPGGNGQISFSEIQDHSIKVSWQAATDNVTAPESLLYKVYFSEYDNISNEVTAAFYGTAAGDFAANIQSKVVSWAYGPMAANKNYFFTVLVKDQAGKIAAYSSKSQYTAKTWEAKAFLKAKNRDTLDLFAYSLAISGNTIVVGAPDEDSGLLNVDNNYFNSVASNELMRNSGAAYVFVTINGQWQPQAYLKASNTDIDDYFGWSVAISGDIIAVSSPWEDSGFTGILDDGNTSTSDDKADSGAVYIFERVNGNFWVPTAYIKAPNTDSGDSFGYSIALSGNRLVIGAPFESSNSRVIGGDKSNNLANSSGAVYVYQKNASNGRWYYSDYLKPSNSDPYDRFGSSLAISGDTIVVGSPKESSNVATVLNGSIASENNSVYESGAAYVFWNSTHQNTYDTWVQQAYLKAPNVGAYNSFGSAVAIDNNTIVIGSYNESSNNSSVIQGDLVNNNNLAAYSGAAYVFVRDSGIWQLQAFLKAPNANAGDHFGRSVAISGNFIVIGSPREDSSQRTLTQTGSIVEDNSQENSGAAYLFSRSQTVWSFQTYIKAANADAGDIFGSTVSISGETAIVGATGEASNQSYVTNGPTASFNNSGSEIGAAYVFGVK